MKTLSKIYAIIALTFRESLARKTFIAFFALSTMLHLFFIFAVNVDVMQGARAMVNIFGRDVHGGKINIEELIIGIESAIAGAGFVGGLFLSIFATASLVPTMLEKGNIELLISKPLSRPLIFTARFIGALSIMIFNVTYLIGGNWLILCIKTNFWYGPYLYSIPMLVAAFATIYALLALMGVTTRSAGFSIMVAFAVLLLSPALVQKDKIYGLLSSKIYYYILEGLYNALPKTFELAQINQTLVMGRPVESWTALWTSTLSALVMLSASIFIFSKKDF
jgi:ABC-type transport system involved in multi-copper enzyme maturation permease subunit